MTPSGMWAGPTLDPMDDKEAARAAVREFLTTRRARVTPADAGLPPQGTRRRVKGLRREEVALLAGVSPEYYVRLERGQATGPSAGVVDAVADVLRLDDDERAHLDRLLAALTPEARKRSRVAAKDPVTPGVRVLLDSLDHLPAVVFNGRLDVLAVNALGRALYAPVFDLPGRPNSARFLFLDEPRARDLFPEWERIAGDTVAMLRTEAGRHPDDPELIELIGQLSTRSTAFRTRWAANDVRAHRGGTKIFRHPLIGEVTLPFENLHVDAASGQVLTVFTPQPGTPEADAIRLLASWNADNEQNNNPTAGTSGAGTSRMICQTLLRRRRERSCRATASSCRSGRSGSTSTRTRHRAVWPEMLAALWRDTGWRNYSLFLRDDGLLIGYVEADDLRTRAGGDVAATEVNARWQAEMAPFFVDLDGRPGRGLPAAGGGLPPGGPAGAAAVGLSGPQHRHRPGSSVSSRSDRPPPTPVHRLE